MYLRYGNYLHVQHEDAVAVSKQLLTNRAGAVYGARETWNISGFIQAASPSALIPLIAAIERAYSISNQTILLLLDDGTTIARGMQGISTLGGTTVQAFSFPDDGARDAEFTTFRRFQATVSGDYPVPSVVGLLSWYETLMFEGGGPRFVHRQPINGLPQRQRVADSTPYRVRQQGNAIGLYSYPSPAPPIWPFDEKRDLRSITNKTPKRSGGTLRPVYTEFEVEWAYTFEAIIPLIGTPTFWS